MELLILLVIACIVLPVACALIRRWYTSYAIAISCGLATLLWFIPLTGEIEGMAFSPVYLITGAHLESIFISIFVHANLIHLAFNVVGLILFGIMLEERIGGLRSVIVFLLGGITGEIFYSIFHWGSIAHLVGASGGIMALVGAFSRLYPYEKVNIFGLFLFLRNVHAWKMALIFISIDLFLAIVTAEVSLSGWMNIAYLAHVGGLLSGLIVAPLLVKIKITGRVDEINPEAIRKVIPDPKRYHEIESAIRGERERDIIDAWLKKIEEVAVCPVCQGAMRLRGATLRCKKGHSVYLAKHPDR